MIKFNSICVFCGSADHLNQEYFKFRPESR